ncbi:ABC transporter permease [Haloferax massiliensis]|uniref:ABC-2 family transporter protein n=1 Tax=Haloferax massiliensis TaxID=1476858 RepID=A0A0D6JV13_9EURY|nr:ABC transporter permease subunit [Haloferax massiliensis]CQR52579.1 ABC-2 family transporter protein [Haloferax massiliensis]
MPSMSVVRTEFQRCLRGKTPWLLALCLLLVSRVPTSPEQAVVRHLGDAAAFPRAQTAVAIVVPFAAAALGFRSVVGERESGTARVLLGTELSRTDLVVGKALGRGAAIMVPVLVTTPLLVAYGTYTYESISLPVLAGLLVAAAAYAFAWTTVTVSLSAAMSSTTRAAGVVFAVTLLLGIFWSDITVALLWNLVTGSTPSNEMAHPELFSALKWFSLPSAYYVLTDWLLGVPVGPGSAALQVSDALRNNGTLATASPPLPVWVGVPIFLAWPALALLVGVSAIRYGDLTPRGGPGRLRRTWANRPSLPRVAVTPATAVVGRGGWVDSLPGRWQPLARREFRRLTHGSGVWLLGATVLVAGVLSLSPSTLVRDALGARVPLAALQSPISVIGGFGTLLLTFRTVVTERDSGSIRMTAGTAVSRSATLVGVIIGRASAIAFSLVLVVLGTCLVAIPQHGVAPPHVLVGFLAVTVAFVYCMTGFGVALSTVVRRQMVAGVAVLVLAGLYLTWFQISNIVYGALTGTAVNGFSPPASPTYLLLRWAPPASLYHVVTNALLGVPNSAGNAAGVLTDALQSNVFSNIVVVRAAYGADVPVWYLHPAVALGELLCWFALPVALALISYRRRALD